MASNVVYPFILIAEIMTSVARNCALLAIVGYGCAVHAQTVARESASPVAALIARVPSDPRHFSATTGEDVATLAAAVDDWAGRQIPFDAELPPDRWLAIVDRLLSVKSRVDGLVEKTLAQRTALAALPADGSRREIFAGYLSTLAALFDLSGRLRYALRDAINGAADVCADSPETFDRLIDLLQTDNSSIGAGMLGRLLLNPPPDDPQAFTSLSDRSKSKILALISAAGELDALGYIASVATDSRSSAEIVLLAAETFCRIGLPQRPIPNQDASLPRPEITAEQLRDAVRDTAKSKLSPSQSRRRDELLKWLDGRIAGGVGDEPLRLGRYEIRPGDWLLMRNPSPYNLFSDLSPGLFTHVGIVARRKASDGVTRLVIVDMPERGVVIPETNVETYLKRTLHYAILRHDDANIATKLGDAAASLVGNPCQFDLNFRTERARRLAGQPLAGEKIETYCAGLLLISAQQTGRPLTEFFPIPERPAGGNTLANLQKVGASIGEDFISPTGPLFSPRMKIVARREPMYSPEREIEQTIYDHFARSMRERTFHQSMDQFQAVRLKLAEASRTNPPLAKALAKVANVNDEMDLVAAAKTAALVETLDEVAYGASRAFTAARNEITSGPARPARRDTRPVRRKHAALVAAWDNNQLSPRDLRIALVRYYIADGKRQLDERFFSGKK
jgi:hypothetical protein